MIALLINDILVLAGKQILLVEGEVVTQRVGYWFVPVLLLLDALGILVFVGFWKMRRWAVYLYIALILFSTILFVSLNQPSPLLSYAVPIVIIGVGLIHIKKMT